MHLLPLNTGGPPHSNSLICLTRFYSMLCSSSSLLIICSASSKLVTLVPGLVGATAFLLSFPLNKPSKYCFHISHSSLFLVLSFASTSFALTCSHFHLIPPTSPSSKIIFYSIWVFNKISPLSFICTYFCYTNCYPCFQPWT